MLKQKYRLKKYSAVIATYKNNNTVSDGNICVYFGREKTDLSSPVKFAFIVSKKVHKRAVVRNRIKRLMRESVRHIILSPDFDFLNNYISIVFAAKKESVTANYAQIDESVHQLLKRKI